MFIHLLVRKFWFYVRDKNDLILGDLARCPIYILSAKRCIKYWIRVLNLPSIRYTCLCYMMVFYFVHTYCLNMYCMYIFVYGPLLKFTKVFKNEDTFFSLMLCMVVRVRARRLWTWVYVCRCAPSLKVKGVKKLTYSHLSCSNCLP